MKTLIATFSISAALLAPVATFAATTAQPTPAAKPATVAVTTATSQDNTNSSRVAMNKAADKSFGKQASDDREGLSRVMEQSRQLGATN